jgi:protein phosphatase
MRLYAWAKTDTGRKRDHNEDGYLVDEGTGLFGVADGMGGHQGGEHASRLALQVMYRHIADARSDLAGAARDIEAARHEELARRGDRGAGPDDRHESGEVSWAANTPTSPSLEPVPAAASSVLRAAARHASWAIFDAALTSPHLRGMGTTLTAMLYDADMMHVVHAGDSRCYLLRGNTIRQITDDHSWIAEQVRAGNLTEAEARTSRYRHVITRSVGFERDLDADARSIAVEAGDCFLLCTDGLSNYIENIELERLMARTWFRRMPQVLVDLANQRGGDDNITLIAVMIANEALDNSS